MLDQRHRRWAVYLKIHLLFVRKQVRALTFEHRKYFTKNDIHLYIRTCSISRVYADYHNAKSEKKHQLTTKLFKISDWVTESVRTGVHFVLGNKCMQLYSNMILLETNQNSPNMRFSLTRGNMVRATKSIVSWKRKFFEHHIQIGIECYSVLSGKWTFQTLHTRWKLSWR